MAASLCTLRARTASESMPWPAAGVISGDLSALVLNPPALAATILVATTLATGAPVEKSSRAGNGGRCAI
jgi:hypothetical protein